MDLNLLIAFIGSSVLLTIMPGPDNIFVLTQSITRGVKTGVLISAGLVSGVLVHTLVAATGLSIILKQSEFLYKAILYCGALYLLFLAFQAVKEKPVLNQPKENGKSDIGIKLIRKGFIMNVLNPKVTLFFVAFLPQFVSSDGFPIPIQFGILGGLFIVQAFLVFFLISFAAGQLSVYMNSPKFWNLTKWMKVVILAGLGMSLLIVG